MEITEEGHLHEIYWICLPSVCGERKAKQQTVIETPTYNNAKLLILL